MRHGTAKTFPEDIKYFAHILRIAATVDLELTLLRFPIVTPTVAIRSDRIDRLSMFENIQS